MVAEKTVFIHKKSVFYDQNEIEINEEISIEEDLKEDYIRFLENIYADVIRARRHS